MSTATTTTTMTGARITVERRPVGRVKQVPYQNECVVAAGSEHAAARRCPFDVIHRTAVTAELEQSLARLADVEDADEVAVGGKGGEEVGVVWGGLEILLACFFFFETQMV